MQAKQLYYTLYSTTGNEKKTKISGESCFPAEIM